ncbi:MAG: formimidoylglutamase [Crocinitomicaceae bacterium]|nr:formimidoylglutamase [Flavobacteriales bacterium]NQZ34632.1 formimidoylglutamase [Crocinitomicaceae bacterium]
MKDISIYFTPVDDSISIQDDRLGDGIQIHHEGNFPDIDNEGVAIIYVPEYRNSEEVFTEINEDFRQLLYNFYKGDSWGMSLYDLGNVLPGSSVEDTWFALGQIVTELVKKDVIPLVIGGGQDLTVACYKGFENLERLINICSIDSSLDIGEPDQEVRSNGFVSHLLMQRPCYLFSFANIGLQRLLASQREIDLFESLYFDVCRLGEFNQDFKKAEPHLRNSDLISLDFQSVRSSDSDARFYSNPNGFYAEQLCQLSKYSGLSDKLSCFGIFNVNPNQNEVASDLLAQLIWYFMDGVANRYGDFPIGSKINYTKFHVHLEEFDDDLVFYKSNKSNRWWMEVKYPAGEGSKYERHHLIPCDRDDYDGAVNNTIPNLWWKTLQKLS